MFTYACAAALALVSIAGLAEGAVTELVANVPGRDGVRQNEDQGIEAAARRFRLQIYTTYRSDRAEFDRRRAAWRQVQARWREAGSEPAEQESLIRWLMQATEQSRPEVRGPLPEIPLFGRLPMHGKLPARSNKKMPRDAAVERVPPLLGPSANRGPSTRTTPRDAVPVPAMAPWETTSPQAGQKPVDVSAPQLKLKGIGRPTAVDDVESPARATGRPKLSALTAPAVSGLQPKQTPLGFEPNPQPAVASTPIRPPKLNGSSALEIEELGVSREVRAIAAPRPHNGDIGPRAPETAPPRRLALARPITTPSAGDATSQFAPSTATKEARSPSGARFNIGELWARASGYRDGLRIVDSALLEAGDLGSTELTELLDELEGLMSQRRELLLYEQVVSAQDRERLVRSLSFPKATVAGLGSRIARVREQLLAPTFDDNTERNRQLQRLEELSLRLSRLHQE
jgi:hypothetical protein